MCLFWFKIQMVKKHFSAKRSVRSDTSEFNSLSLNSRVQTFCCSIQAKKNISLIEKS